jgi:predicted 3-demethylubiquinone-9 3-methyltransferase (glyoxalase superfamily)
MDPISPCLWFEGQAEEAAKFYTSLFKDSKMGYLTRYGKSASKASGQKEGSVMCVRFEIAGLPILGLNGGPYFKHSPSMSLFVWCNSEKEIDHLWKELSKGGNVRMGLDKYPWSQKYGWTTDKYGVEWQLILHDPNQEPPAKIATAFLFVDNLFGKGQEAIDYYTSVFKDSKVQMVHKDEATGTVMHAQFQLLGQQFVLMEGQGKHGHKFTEAFSNMIACKDQKEIDYYTAKLSADPNAEMCGWIKDKFGVSWQITPAAMDEWHKDPVKSEKAMAVIMKMKKLDIAAIEAAIKG